MTAALLELDRVDAFYGSAHILHQLSLAVGGGERVALVGRNGVGKTTVVNTILGLASLRGGTIRLGPASTARQTLATFEHFIDLLRVDRDSDVSVLQQPFEIESGRALRGGDVENESSQARQFTVKISRKLPT